MPPSFSVSSVYSSENFLLFLFGMKFNFVAEVFQILHNVSLFCVISMCSWFILYLSFMWWRRVVIMCVQQLIESFALPSRFCPSVCALQTSKYLNDAKQLFFGIYSAIFWLHLLIFVAWPDLIDIHSKALVAIDGQLLDVFRYSLFICTSLFCINWFGPLKKIIQIKNWVKFKDLPNFN